MNSRAQQSFTSVASIATESSSLVTLPEICIRLRETLADERHNNNDVCAIISVDPSISARVLRVVNSAYLGLSKPISEISKALGFLGEKELNNLVVVTAIIQSTKGVETEFDMKAFWQRSIYSAVLAKNLSTASKAGNREELFLIGLLLNIGKLPLYMKEPELFQHIKSRQIPEHEAELETLGFTHAEVGEAMTKHWNLSSQISNAIGQQHHKPESNDDNIKKIFYLCSMTDAYKQTDEDKEKFYDGIDQMLLPKPIELEGYKEIVEQTCESFQQIYLSFFN